MPRKDVRHRHPARHLVAKVCRLHLELRILGTRKLTDMIYRVTGRMLSRSTIRRIVIRRRDLVREPEQGRKVPPRHIDIPKPRVLWGLDLTVVMVLGVLPMKVLGVVDYHGSRVVALQPVGLRANSGKIVDVIRQAFASHGVPKRILTDNEPVLCSRVVDKFLDKHGVKHQRTRPAHPWTNGRIERSFRTAKETFFSLVWLISSRAQLDRFCTDFVQWHNCDRPHASYCGNMPDEINFGPLKRAGAVERITYFDGLLPWYRLR